MSKKIGQASDVGSRLSHHKAKACLLRTSIISHQSGAHMLLFEENTYEDDVFTVSLAEALQMLDV